MPFNSARCFKVIAQQDIRDFVFRFKSLPHVLKLNTLGATVLVILSVGATSHQPPGTHFIWMTSVFALIVDLFCVAILGLEVEKMILPVSKHNSSFLTWPLVECIFSILFAITFFISAWLCIMVGSTYYEGSLPFTLAGVFCLGNFIQYTFNVLLFIKIWIAEHRKEMHVINISSFGVSSYGSP